MAEREGSSAFGFLLEGYGDCNEQAYKAANEAGFWDNVLPESPNSYYDPNASDDSSDTDDETFDPKVAEYIRRSLIKRSMYADIQKQKSILVFNSHNSLKALCMLTILKNQDFFEKLAQNMPESEHFRQLPPTVLDSMCEEIMTKTTDKLRVDCNFFSALIHPAKTSVRFGGCKSHSESETGKLCNESTAFWKALSQATNLKRLCFLDIPPSTIHDEIVKFKHLQVIDMPCLECDDKHLVLFATNCPNLQELNVKLVAINIDKNGVEALSQLQHFSKFTFFIDGRQLSPEEHKKHIRKFMVRCLWVMPWLKRIGHTTQPNPDWSYYHPVHAFKSEDNWEFELEVLVLKGNLAVLESCSFPDLLELYLIKPHGDVNVLKKFPNLVHLYITNCSSFLTVTKTLELVGSQLSSLHLRSIPGIVLETVFSLCPSVEKVTIEAVMSNQTFLKPVLVSKLSELTINAYSSHESLVIQSSAFRDIIVNSKLKLLDLINVCISNEDASYLEGLVKRKEILQDIETIIFRNVDFSDIDPPDRLIDNDLYVIPFLTQCAISCPKLSLITCKNGTDADAVDIFDVNLKKAGRRWLHYNSPGSYERRKEFYLEKLCDNAVMEMDDYADYE